MPAPPRARPLVRLVALALLAPALAPAEGEETDASTPTPPYAFARYDGWKDAPVVFHHYKDPDFG